MTQFNGRVIGEQRDLPQDLGITAIASASAGSAADLELLVGVLPSRLLHYLPTRLPSASGAATAILLGAASENRQKVEQAGFINASGSAVVSNSAANYFDYRLNVWRSGSAGVVPALQGCIAYYSMQVDTTLGTAVATANTSVTCTAASMTGIVPGMLLQVDTSTSLELVYVLSTTSTTFTAFFTKTHASNATVLSVLPAWGATPFIPAVGVVNTTSSTTLTSGSHAFTPASMYGIQVGASLTFAGGTGATETVTVTAVTATTATATFANGHSGGYTITRNDGHYFELQGGDILTLARVSSNVTGLASPTGGVYVSWNPTGIPV